MSATARGGAGPATASPLQVGFALPWREAERAVVARCCPPGLACHFLSGEPDAESTILAALDVLVVGTARLPNRVIDAAPRLRLIQRWGTGLDSIDLAHAARRGIGTAELPGVNARSVSEFIVCAILCLLRHVPDVALAWSDGRWLAGPERPTGRRLEAKTVGLLGYGAIGRDLASLLRGFDAALIQHDLRVTKRDGVAEPVDRDELLRRSDVLCVQLPSTPATQGLIGTTAIERMKPSAVIVSVSRAGVVDEHAVRRAVREGRLAGASFDNFEPEPLPADAIAAEPRILATPHMAGATAEGFQNLALACFDTILRHARPPDLI